MLNHWLDKTCSLWYWIYNVVRFHRDHWQSAANVGQVSSLSLGSARRSQAYYKLKPCQFGDNRGRIFCPAIIYDTFLSNFNLWERHFLTICLISSQDVSGILFIDH